MADGSGRGRADRILAEARAAADLLDRLGERRAAAAVRSLCTARAAARETNSRLWLDNRGLRRALAAAAHDPDARP